MIIVFILFFIITTGTLVFELKKDSPPTSAPYIALYITGLLTAMIFYAAGTISQYHMIGMLLFPVPCVVAAQFIVWVISGIHPSKAFIGPAPSNQSLYVTKATTASTQSTYVTEVDALETKVNDVLRSINQLEENLKRINENYDNQKIHYENYVDGLNDIKSRINHFDKEQAQHRTKLDSIVKYSTRHSHKFDSIGLTLEQIFWVRLSLSKSIEHRLVLVSRQQEEIKRQQKIAQRQKAKKLKRQKKQLAKKRTQATKKVVQKQQLWEDYQKIVRSFTEQKKKVIATKKQYQERKRALQKLLAQHNIDILELPQLETQDSTKVDEVTLNAMKDLQTEVGQLKQQMLQDRQALTLQDTNVQDAWLEYQNISGSKKLDASVWAYYDTREEELFWEKYDQILVKKKRSRTVTIQMAG